MLKHRTGWATHELRKAGLLHRENAAYSITDEGKNILKKNLNEVNKKILLEIPEYQKQVNATKKENEPEPKEISEQTPVDMIVSGHKIIKDAIQNELLENINKNSPSFFEMLVLELIRKMGYGIDHQVLGRTGDGGIDGVIQLDKLGLDKIYFQAKRWQNTVLIHQVKDFAGALLSKKSKKGIFITSSEFSNDAHEFVKNIDAKIILINGYKLTEYMYEYDLGVSVENTFEIKKIDEGYFLN